MCETNINYVNLRFYHNICMWYILYRYHYKYILFFWFVIILIFSFSASLYIPNWKGLVALGFNHLSLVHSHELSSYHPILFIPLCLDFSFHLLFSPFISKTNLTDSASLLDIQIISSYSLLFFLQLIQLLYNHLPFHFFVHCPYTIMQYIIYY